MSDDITRIGIDVGNNKTKACVRKNDEVITLKIDSCVAQEPAQFETAVGTKDNLSTIAIEIDGVPFIVGDDIDAMPTESTYFSLNNPKIAMIYAVMAKLSISGQVSLVATMPFNTFYGQNGIQRTDAIKAHNELLKKNVHFFSKTIKPIQIVQSTSFAESTAIFISLIMDDRKLADQNLLLFDIGGGTVERAVYKGHKIDLKYAVSKPLVGVHSIFNLIKFDLMDLIRAKYGRCGDISDLVVSQALETKAVHFYGERVECGDIIDKHLRAYTSRLQGMMTTQLGDASMFDKIIFAGGGAKLLESYLRENLWFPNENRYLFLDEFANAKACLAIAEYQQ